MESNLHQQAYTDGQINALNTLLNAFRQLEAHGIAPSWRLIENCIIMAKEAALAPE